MTDVFRGPAARAMATRLQRIRTRFGYRPAVRHQVTRHWDTDKQRYRRLIEIALRFKVLHVYTDEIVIIIINGTGQRCGLRKRY